MEAFVTDHTFRHRAQCECGWQGKMRWLRASAVVDAGLHAAQTNHFPGYVLGTPTDHDAVLQVS